MPPSSREQENKGLWDSDFHIYFLGSVMMNGRERIVLDLSVCPSAVRKLGLLANFNFACYFFYQCKTKSSCMSWKFLEANTFRWYQCLTLTPWPRVTAFGAWSFRNKSRFSFFFVRVRKKYFFPRVIFKTKVVGDSNSADTLTWVWRETCLSRLITKP